MKKSLSALVVVAGMFFAGCAVGQKYQRPTVAAPPSFRGDSTTPPDATSLADLKWFEVFKDTQLQELVKTALVNNYDLREAVARVEASRAALGITRADQYPAISSTAGVTTQRTSANGSFTLPQNFDQSRTFGSVELNLLSFELDIWGRLRNATAAARADLLANEETQKAVVTTLVSDVTTAYFQLLELDGEMDVAKRTLGSRENSLMLIKNREKAGLATTLEVRQGEQLVQVAAEAIPDIERQQAQTENQLRLLLGENPSAVARAKPLTQQEQPPTLPAGLPSSLLERRPDIRAAEENLIARSATVKCGASGVFSADQLDGAARIPEQSAFEPVHGSE